MPCCNPKAGSAINACLLRDGPIHCALAIRTNASTLFGIIFVSTGRKIRDCVSIICCSAPTWRHGSAMPVSIAGSAASPTPATTRRRGSNSIWAQRRKRHNRSAARSRVPTPPSPKRPLSAERGQPAFVQVDVIEHSENRPEWHVGLLEANREARGKLVAPTALGDVVVPDFDLLVGGLASVREGPFEHLIITSTFYRLPLQCFVVNLKKAATGAVESRHGALRLGPSARESPLMEQPNFVEHPAEVQDASEF